MKIVRGHSNDLRSILPTHTATRTVLNVYYVFMQAGPGVSVMPSVYHHARFFTLPPPFHGWLAHVISDTRPSPFSACNIEKVGVAWGRGYVVPIITIIRFRLFGYLF